MQSTKLSNKIRTKCFVSELITIQDDQFTPKSVSIMSCLLRCDDRSLAPYKERFFGLSKSFASIELCGTYLLVCYILTCSRYACGTARVHMYVRMRVKVNALVKRLRTNILKYFSYRHESHLLRSTRCVL